MLLNSKCHIDRLHVYRNISQQLFYFIINVCYAFPAIFDQKTFTLRMDHAKLLDVLTSLPVSQSILPRAVYFATSRPANHAICSFIDSSGYASGPIRRCLFIDYIIISFIFCILNVIFIDCVTSCTFPFELLCIL